jgi:hypothetical protein
MGSDPDPKRTTQKARDVPLLVGFPVLPLSENRENLAIAQDEG